MVDRDPTYGVQRRVAGPHDLRLDGVADILTRCRGKSVLDLGCNRGMVAYEMAINGARVLHGADSSPTAIEVAREVFADMRQVQQWRFEVCDLSEGPKSLEPFGNGQWDIILMLATLHKLGRIMSREDLAGLLTHLGGRCTKWFVWRSTERNVEGNKLERELLNQTLGQAGMQQVHYSEMSVLGPAGIWQRGPSV